MQTHTFWAPKRGNHAEDYEDACAADAQSGRFAIADGATESSFARDWARLLVDGYLGTPVTDGPGWTDWLPPLQAAWLAQVGDRPLPWYAEAKFAQGAFATFLGLVIEPRGWRAVAVGDCCLFHLRRGRLKRAFPVTRSGDFSNVPCLLGSRTPPAEAGAHRAVWAKGRWRVGDRFWLMTDALAQWFLRDVERDREPWNTLNAMVAGPASGDEFVGWVEQLRDQQAIRNDDVTLLTVEV